MTTTTNPTATDIHNRALRALDVSVRKTANGVAVLVDGVQVLGAARRREFGAVKFGPVYAANSNLPRFFDSRAAAADFMVAEIIRRNPGRVVVR